ncbi:SHOCT domain-containing protein [Paenibacillus agri]|uniref:SHOCT domain-containing protein n=1 Tax=Paenibacillus agri TaxID=2744309 RepID=A0A850EQW8_9BACL|nr:SHOCT domain-containing protein [Paenibacillus agri]NUU60431.1 SHOCT domain-containing protein [Paenibacillus agri]
MKKRLIAASVLALSVTLGGGTLLAGNVLAASTVQTTPNPTSATKGPVNGTLKGKGFEWGGERGAHARLDNAAIATLLGVTEKDLKTAEQAGKSLAVIAGEKGVAVQTVVDLVTKQLTTNLDKQLADGKITQAEYDKQKANLATKAGEIVNRTFTGKGEHGKRVKLDNAAIATLLGVTEKDLKTAEQAGKSLAVIAGEKGVAVQTVVDLVSKQLTTNLDKKLADGKITQAEYDKQKANLATKAGEIVNHTFVNRGGHGKFDRNQG